MENNQILVKLASNDEYFMPKKAHVKVNIDDSEDGCFDVFAREIVETSNGCFTIYLGFSTAIPAGFSGIIKPRSSFTSYNYIMNNSPGEIDSNYRGEWCMKIMGIPTSAKVISSEDNKNFDVRLEYDPCPFKVRDAAVAQIKFEKNQDVLLKISSSLPMSSRGTNGFGSTNKNVHLS